MEIYEFDLAYYLSVIIECIEAIFLAAPFSFFVGLSFTVLVISLVFYIMHLGLK